MQQIPLFSETKQDVSSKDRDSILFELRKVKEFAESMFMCWPNGSSLLDLEGNRIISNLYGEQIQKRTIKQLQHMKIEDMYVSEDACKIKNTIKEAKTHGFSSCEVTLIQGDGTKLPVVMNYGALKDKQGKVINFIVSITDISELHKREEELRKRDQEQRRAISSFMNVLTRTAAGDLTVRISIEGWNKELALIGEAINTLIATLEYESLH